MRMEIIFVSFRLMSIGWERRGGILRNTEQRFSIIPPI